MRAIAIIALILIGITSVYSQADDAEINKENTIGSTGSSSSPSSSLPSAPSGISTAFVFPEHPDRKIISGEVIEVVMGFVNHGYMAMNITHLSAGLSHPLDRNHYIQNYSKAEYGLAVNPNEQISVSYRFRPDTLLDPRDYGLVAIVYFHDERGRQHVLPFFNGTITIVEVASVFDFQQFFLYVFFLALIGGATYYYTQVYAPGSATGSKKSNKSKYVAPSVYEETGTKTRAVEEDDEWLQGTNVLRSKSPKQVRNKQQVNSEIKEKVQDLKENQAKKDKVHKEINKEIKDVAKAKEIHKVVNKEIKDVAKTKEAHKEVNKEIKDGVKSTTSTKASSDSSAAKSNKDASKDLKSSGKNSKKK